MRGGDDQFALLDREGIDRWPILLRDAQRAESLGRIVLLRMILVTKVKRATQRADDVVIRT